MPDLEIRYLDESVASALKARVSLEEEVRRALTTSVAADREELAAAQRRCTPPLAAWLAAQSLTAREPSAKSGMPGDESCAPETSRWDRI
jgi:plasmid stability protein